jgi:seryl-tRNA synthetase
MPKLKGAEKEAKLAEMKELAEALKHVGQTLKELEERWNKESLRLPSIPLDVVPVGKDDSENRPVRSWGEIKTHSFELRDHVQLAKSLDLFDIERGVKIAGARSYFLKGDGARLSHAVMSLAMDHLHKQGYTLMDPPHIVTYQAMLGTGYFPGGEEMAYHLDQRDDTFHLIGTSEVPVASYHADEILDLSELPKRYAGYSPCYRREAGAYGKDTYGLYRVHQFYKVEQVVLCRADTDESMKLHYELLGNAEQVMQLLELPYRIVDVCTGDMGQGQVFKHDIEAWMPSRKAYGETHSCSSFYDFQARRLNTRYKDTNGKNTFCYTLNNTCIASPRILIPLLENHQNSDGSVTIPLALRPYMGGQELVVPKS